MSAHHRCEGSMTAFDVEALRIAAEGTVGAAG
jgi:hypothetical protein